MSSTPLSRTAAQTNLMDWGMNDEHHQGGGPEAPNGYMLSSSLTMPRSPGSTIGSGPAWVRCLCRYGGCALRLGWCGWVWSRLMAPRSTPMPRPISTMTWPGDLAARHGRGSHVREVG